MLHNYHCTRCGAQDQRVAGLDDHTARCVVCSGVMLRTSDDPFEGYWSAGPGPILSMAALFSLAGLFLCWAGTAPSLNRAMGWGG